jgi:hypothetical protein
MATTELERPIQDDVVAFAKGRGWLHRRFENKRGDPDDLFAKGGRVILVEFKRPLVVRARRQQDERHKEWRAAGVEVFLINDREKGYALFR